MTKRLSEISINICNLYVGIQILRNYVNYQFNKFSRYESKYTALEVEFREALQSASSKLSKLRDELDQAKEQNVAHQIEREKLLGQISHGAEQLKTEQKRLKESVQNSHMLEDKIERLVEAVRKSKELGWV